MGEQRSKLMKAALYLLAGGIVYTVATTLGNQSAQVANERLAEPTKSGTQSDDIANVQLFVTRQAADGFLQSDFDQAALATIEGYLRQRSIALAKQKYEMDGYDPSDFEMNLTSNAVFVEGSGHKIGVVRMREPDMGIRVTVLMALMDNELVRVTCLRQSDHEISIFYGPCGDKAEKVFGLRETSDRAETGQDARYSIGPERRPFKPVNGSRYEVVKPNEPAHEGG